MSLTFLDKVAEYILRHHGDHPEKLTVVLPGRRGILYLKRSIGKAAAIPQVAPRIITTEVLAEELSGLFIADATTQLVEFYHIYRESEGSDAESFDTFCQWAPTLLHDFSDCDNYLCDATQLFGNLSDIKGIENWSLGAPELTDFQKKYLHFWEQLGKWYQLLNKRLLELNSGTAGYVQRIALQNSGRSKNFILFCGFNALTAAERKLIDDLQKKGKAASLWDYDEYYLNNVSFEAGIFFRKNQPLFGVARDFEHIENKLSTQYKTINIIGAAGAVAEVHAAGEVLSVLREEELARATTALIFADEQLLVPALHALPDNTGDINVTMGYPAKTAPIASFAQTVFNLQLNGERFNIRTAKTGQLKYYHQDLLRLFSHPYTCYLLTAACCAELEAVIKKRNYIFCAEEQLTASVTVKHSELLSLLLSPWNDVLTALKCLTSLMLNIRDRLNEVADEATRGAVQMEQEFLYEFYLTLNKTHHVLSKSPETFTLKSLRALIQQALQQITIPFYGEPLSGLQIMGMLETRTLDFDRIIVTGVNENILPTGKSQQSFIVNDLRNYFELPSWNEKDAVYAYHFYRLLQRANEITLIYNTETENSQSKERSRFITQLLYELPGVNRQATITERMHSFAHSEESQQHIPIVIRKTPAILDKLETLNAKGFSPSAINTYRQCSLQYYFRYVLGIFEAEEVEESASAATMGTLIHKVLQDLFTPVLQQPLNPKTIATISAKVEQFATSAFMEKFAEEGKLIGKNLLAKEMAVYIVRQFLKSEQTRVELIDTLYLAELESPLLRNITLPTGKQINFQGTADRIDITPYAVYLLDYKTGKVEAKQLMVSDWESLTHDTSKDKAFQLLQYAWMYEPRSQGKTIVPGIIPLKSAQYAPMFLSVDNSTGLSEQQLQKFEQQLTAIITELFADNTPFAPTPEIKTCTRCRFNTTCKRNQNASETDV
jgi:ATP-dependent helicase/nuclease subunit B